MIRKTLSVMRSLLQARLGNAAAAASSTLQSTILNSFLFEAQDEIARLCDWQHRMTRTSFSTVVGQVHYDYSPNTSTWSAGSTPALNAYRTPLVTPNGLRYQVTARAGTGTTAGTEPIWPLDVGLTVIDNPGANQVTWTCVPPEINVDRMINMAVLYGSVYEVMEEGITWDMLTFETTQTVPQRYARYGTLENQLAIWPQPDLVYTIAVEHMKHNDNFVADTDYTSMEPNLILQYALVKAKAHYRHPDAELYARTWELAKRKLQSQNSQRRVFKPAGEERDFVAIPIQV